MNTVRLSSLSLAGLLLATSALAADEAAGEDRVIRSAAGFAAEHAPNELRDPLTFRETVTPSNDVVTKARSAGPGGPKIASATLGDSYVYTAKTDLFSDRDNDGYYHHLKVTFDADSIFDPARLYAIIYVSADGNAWEQLFTTDDFTVHGSSPDDAYEVETDLVSGYSTGLYDVLIELYDAASGTLVDSYGPNESPDFSVRPLEDSYRDGDPPPPDPAPVVTDGGGGAIDWLTLPALLAAAVWARRRRGTGAH
ncbi:MAG TPA: choice-of-anchor H family protein [Gammaproteobacteria bacterium]|nr:choice-of-anchor H family protein [Gammaproteobacteria bacterium]